MTIELSENVIEAIADAVVKKMQEPCDDAISRADVKKYLSAPDANGDRIIYESDLDLLPPVTPQPKMGSWLRMSDLSEQEDDRYKCSRCGNVIHYKNKMNLYTFNGWCGRCGSDNSRKRG